jgi:hypothetical protein
MRLDRQYKPTNTHDQLNDQTRYACGHFTSQTCSHEQEQRPAGTRHRGLVSREGARN